LPLNCEISVGNENSRPCAAGKSRIFRRMLLQGGLDGGFDRQVFSFTAIIGKFWARISHSKRQYQPVPTLFSVQGATRHQQPPESRVHPPYMPCGTGRLTFVPICRQSLLARAVLPCGSVAVLCKVGRWVSQSKDAPRRHGTIGLAPAAAAPEPQRIFEHIDCDAVTEPPDFTG